WKSSVPLMGLRLTGSSRGGGRIEPTLGVDQERAGRRDFLARVETLEHREAVADAGSQDDWPALEDAGLGLDVDDLARAGVDDRRVWKKGVSATGVSSVTIAYMPGRSCWPELSSE